MLTTDKLQCVVWTSNKSQGLTDPFVSAGWLDAARMGGTDANSSMMLLILRCTPTAFLFFFGGMGTGFVAEAPDVDWTNSSQHTNRPV